MFPHPIVPTYAGMPITESASSLDAGVGFQLVKPPRETRAVRIGQWTVQVDRKKSVVVSRGVGLQSYHETMTGGASVVQDALDLISTLYADNLNIQAAEDEHVAWWPIDGKLNVRVVSSLTLFIDGLVLGTGRDEYGRITSITPTPTWHESFRYFRLSQVSDDLFDAYRNAYLALECILASIVPQRRRASGKPDEGEGEWLRRALRTVDRKIIPLKQFVPAGTADPVQYIFDDTYAGIRSEISHAKIGRKVLLPRTASERNAVVAGLIRVVELYLELAGAHLGFVRASGAISQEAFEAAHRGVLDNLEVFGVQTIPDLGDSDYKVDPSSSLPLHPEGRAMSPEEFVLCRTWSSDLTAPVEIAGFVGMLNGASLGVISPTREPLLLTGSERIQHTVYSYGGSGRSPRKSYIF